MQTRERLVRQLGRELQIARQHPLRIGAARRPQLVLRRVRHGAPDGVLAAGVDAAERSQGQDVRRHGGAAKDEGGDAAEAALDLQDLVAGGEEAEGGEIGEFAALLENADLPQRPGQVGRDAGDAGIADLDPHHRLADLHGLRLVVQDQRLPHAEVDARGARDRDQARHLAPGGVAEGARRRIDRERLPGGHGRRPGLALRPALAGIAIVRRSAQQARLGRLHLHHDAPPGIDLGLQGEAFPEGVQRRRPAGAQRGEEAVDLVGQANEGIGGAVPDADERPGLVRARGGAAAAHQQRRQQDPHDQGVPAHLHRDLRALVAQAGEAPPEVGAQGQHHGRPQEDAEVRVPLIAAGIGEVDGDHGGAGQDHGPGVAPAQHEERPQEGHAPERGGDEQHERQVARRDAGAERLPEPVIEPRAQVLEAIPEEGLLIDGAEAQHLPEDDDRPGEQARAQQGQPMRAQGGQQQGASERQHHQEPQLGHLLHPPGLHDAVGNGEQEDRQQGGGDGPLGQATDGDGRGPGAGARRRRPHLFPHGPPHG